MDSALVDSARVLRMPYSFNCKAFDPKNKRYDSNNPQAIATTDIGWTEKRYSVTDIFAKIQSLPDVIPTSKGEFEKNMGEICNAVQKPITEKAKKQDKEKRESLIIEVKNVKIEEVKKEYPMLPYVDKLPEPLIKMLYRTPQGIRNSTMLFLVPFLKNTLGFNVKKIKEVLSVWCRRCSPQLPLEFVISEVDRLLSYEFKGKCGVYNKDMTKAFGFFEFNEYSRENKVRVPNEFFKDMSAMEDGSFRIYLALLLDKSNHKQRNYTCNEICELSGIKRSALYLNFKDLITMGYLCKKRACKKNGEEYEYYLNPFLSAKEGFTLVDKATIKLMLQELSNAEMKLYGYLCSLFNSQNKINVGQERLAEVIGKSRNRVCELTNGLHDKGFLNKTTMKVQNVLYCTYNLNY